MEEAEVLPGSGSFTLKVTRRTDPAEHGTVEFAVTDSGIGMTAR